MRAAIYAVIYPYSTSFVRTDLLRTQFEPNLFGLMEVTMAGLPYLRERKGSTLVFIGSRSAWKTDNLVSCFLSPESLSVC